MAPPKVTPAWAPVTPVVVAITSAGDNIIVSSTAGKTIFVHGLVATSSSPVNVTLKDGASVISGVLAGSTSVVLDPFPAHMPPRWAVVSNFIINLSAAVSTFGGIVWVTQE
jgi:hypothetical protein